MTLAEQKAVVAHTSEAFSDTEPNVVTEAAKAVLKDSEARGGGVQMLGVDKIYPGSTVKALDDFNLEINPGEMVVLLGGSFQHDAEANVGPLTKLGLSQFSVDKCFIGADAISEEKGVSTINLFRAEVVRSMSESAGKMIVLTTSDKIGGSAVASVFPLDHLHTLITDTDIKPADQHMLERAGVNVLTV